LALLEVVINSNEDVKNHTLVGVLKGKLPNSEEIERLSPLNIGEMFAQLRKEVEQYYA
jgi:hypothetical protein